MVTTNNNTNKTILIDRNGEPLTQDEIRFLELIKYVQKEFGSGVVLAIRTLMEAAIKKH